MEAATHEKGKSIDLFTVVVKKVCEGNMPTITFVADPQP
jgi:hypothetical protein